MGCSASSSVYDKHPELSKWSDQFHALQLSNSDVKQLYKEFKNIDISSGRTIELLELLVYMNMDKTSFSERVFLLFDTDNSGPKRSCRCHYRFSAAHNSIHTCRRDRLLRVCGDVVELLHAGP